MNKAKFRTDPIGFITLKYMGWIFTSLVLTMFFMSCSGEDGENGMNGINGMDGIDGIDGTDGVDGTNGVDGDINVIYSQWLTSPFTEPISNSQVAANFNNQTDITQEIIDNGAILLFGREANSSITYALPVTFSGGGNLEESHWFRAEVGVLRVGIHDLNAVPIDNRFIDEYRYILIPGGTSAKGTNSHIDFQKMSYEAVITHFGIPE